MFSTREAGEVVQTVHLLFDQWEEKGIVEAQRPAWLCTRVLVHEWVANLVQHADFDGRTPCIYVGLSGDSEGLWCTIRDNSEGFDFHAHVGHRSVACIPRELPERKMGLLMLRGGTERLAYTRESEARNTLRFCVPASADAY